MRQFLVLSASALALLAPGTGLAQTAEPDGADEIIVVGRKTTGTLTVPSADQAAADARRVAGGTDVIDLSTFANQAARNIQDITAYSPGVFAQSQTGTDQTRLSIRGSGIAETVLVRGLSVTRDGLTLGQTNGQFRSQLVEPFFADYVEIYRGANALEYGGATLGGAINLVSPTGYSRPGLRLGLLGGSHDMARAQASIGGVSGDWDGVIAGAISYNGGFRDFLEQDAVRLFGNVGYRHSPTSETRLLVEYQDIYEQRAGSLTLAQVREDPTQADARNIPYDAHYELQHLRVGLRHAWALGDSQKLDIGLSYQRNEYLTVSRFGYLPGVDHDVVFSGRYEWRDTAIPDNQAIDQRRFVGGWRLGLGHMKNPRYRILPGGERGEQRLERLDKPLLAELFGQHEQPLGSNLKAIAGAQFVYAHRNVRSDALDTTLLPADAEQDFYGFNPKLGLMWQPAEGVQVFGNVSRSYELPDDYEFANSDQPGTIDEQTATTFEIGTRGNRGIFNWDATVYYSRIDNEILLQETPLGSGIYLPSNADDTRHFGVEIGIGATVPDLLTEGDKLSLRSSYTYSDFRYKSDPAWGDNRLPGIPKQTLRAEIVYEHSSGFFFGPNIEHASGYYVDFANSVKAPAYTLIGARAGINVTQDFSLFVEGRNLTDRHYVSSTGITDDLGGADTRIFNPGLTRSVFVGLRGAF